MKLYKIVGWILIILGIISILYTLFFSTTIFDCKVCNLFDYLYHFGGYLLIIVLLFIFSYFPGKVYIKTYKENKLLKGSLIFTIIALIISILTILFILFAIISDPRLANEPFGMALILIMVAWPIGIAYGVAILLLIINWVKNR